MLRSGKKEQADGSRIQKKALTIKSLVLNYAREYIYLCVSVFVAVLGQILSNRCVP